MALTPEVRVSEADVNVVAVNPPSAIVQISQANSFAVFNVPTVALQLSQAHTHVVILRGAEAHNLRAWTFTQDDHAFYVLRLGDMKTLVYDQLTSMWAEWKSPGLDYWRGEDGCDWQGINVACDNTTGKIWKIDPDGRLDYNDTPIVSQIFGGKTLRFRKFEPCFMAEVAVSETGVPDGIDPTTIGMQLRTSDTINWTDHGTVQAQPVGTQMYARWYGLGLMKSPGALFEITDFGYARRIDGLNIEIGAANGNA